MQTRVTSETLTDGSKVYNVVVIPMTSEGFPFAINCESERGANAVADALTQYAIGIEFDAGAES